LILSLKDELTLDKNKYTLSKHDYIEWKIHNWNELNENKLMKSPNFKIGNLIWYV